MILLYRLVVDIIYSIGSLSTWNNRRCVCLPSTDSFPPVTIENQSKTFRNFRGLFFNVPMIARRRFFTQSLQPSRKDISPLIARFISAKLFILFSSPNCLQSFFFLIFFFSRNFEIKMVDGLFFLFLSFFFFYSFFLCCFFFLIIFYYCRIDSFFFFYNIPNITIKSAIFHVYH